MSSSVTKWRSREISAAVRLEVERRMEKAVRIVQADAVKSIARDQPVRRTKSGRLVGLEPSLPGEPPKVLHGRLHGAIDVNVAVTSRSVVGRVGSNLVYARALELGYPQGGLEPRPYLRPALFGNKPRLRKIFGVNVR